MSPVTIYDVDIHVAEVTIASPTGTHHLFSTFFRANFQR
jgi:hypothetical protein